MRDYPKEDELDPANDVWRRCKKNSPSAREFIVWGVMQMCPSGRAGQAFSIKPIKTLL